MTLTELKSNHTDTPYYHRHIHELFVQLAEGTYLGEHRKWCREHVFGFGEDSFPYMWKLLAEEMPNEFTFCEIGCFKFQTVTLIKLIANNLGKKVNRVCVSPMDSSGGVWNDDYFAHAKTIHEHFDIPQDYTLCYGSSTDQTIIELARLSAPFDLLYVDGSHEFSDVVSDLHYYPEMVKVGGYVVIDDAACRMSMDFGVFQGIEDVCRAVSDWEKDARFEFQFNVVHNMVYKRIA